MDKKNKGLVDNQEGEIILNESGTSISTEATEEEVKQYDEVEPAHKPKEDTEEISGTDDI